MTLLSAAQADGSQGALGGPLLRPCPEDPPVLSHYGNLLPWRRPCLPFSQASCCLWCFVHMEGRHLESCERNRTDSSSLREEGRRSTVLAERLPSKVSSALAIFLPPGANTHLHHTHLEHLRISPVVGPPFPLLPLPGWCFLLQVPPLLHGCTSRMWEGGQSPTLHLLVGLVQVTLPGATHWA